MVEGGGVENGVAGIKSPHSSYLAVPEGAVVMGCTRPQNFAHSLHQNFEGSRRNATSLSQSTHKFLRIYHVTGYSTDTWRVGGHFNFEPISRH